MSNNSIEVWLHQIIAEEHATNGWAAHVPFSRHDVEAYQLFKLRRILQYVYDNSSFYRNLFTRSGIIPERVHTLDDLALLPFTEPERLAEEPYRFLCISRAEIARPYSFVTSGTTGPQKKIFWTHKDLEKITDFMAAGMGMVAGPDDVIQIILPDGRPDSQADLLRKGVLKLGAKPVVAGMGMSADEQFELQQSAHSTVIFGYAGRIYRMSKELEAKRNLRKCGVRVLFLAAEYLPDARRRELQRIWGCPVHTHYGLTEMGLGVAVECEARYGYHFNEADLLLEVVNPRSGKRADEGEEGELVFTTLTREAMPLLRYRTHDLSRLIPEPCPCGASTLLRIDNVRKRLESLVILKSGDELYPALLDDILAGIPGLIDYQAVLARSEGKDLLDLKIELIRERPDSISSIREKLLSLQILAKNIGAGNMAAPRIEIAPWGTLQSAPRAKKMIVDIR